MRSRRKVLKIGVAGAGTRLSRGVTACSISRWTAAMVVGLALVVGLIAAPSVAMAITTVQGTITNSSAVVLPGMKVYIQGTVTSHTDSAVTNAAGLYTFSVNATDTYTLLVQDPAGFYVQDGTRNVAVLATGTVNTADITMMRPGGLSGTVTDALTLAAVQEIEASSYHMVGINEYWDGTAYTDAFGKYAISGAHPGPHAVEFVDVSIDRTLPYATQRFVGPAVVVEGATTPNINAALASGSVIAGRVTDAANGIGIGNTIITLRSTPASDLAWTSTAADGTYRMLGSAAGTYTVAAHSPTSTLSPLPDYVTLSQSVPLAANQVKTNVNFALTRTAPGGYLTGRVVNAVGASLGGIEVHLAMSGGHSPVTYSTVTSSTGSFSLPARTGTIALSFFDPTGAHPSLEATRIVAGAGVLGNFTLGAIGRVAGRIINASGTPIAGATVRLWNATDTVSPRDSASTGVNGSYSFGELPAGNYKLSFDADGYLPEYYSNASIFASATVIPVVAANVAIPDVVLAVPAVGFARFEQSSPMITYAGTWTTATAASYSGGNLKVARGVGTGFTANFTGTSIKWIALVGPGYGIARVTVDGGAPVLVDLYSAAYRTKQTVWSTSGLAAGPHTLRVEWTGTRNIAATNDYINLDALDVAGALTQAPPIPVLARFEQTDPRIAFASAWTTATAAGYSGGSLKVGSGAGVAFTANFTGTGVKWIALVAPTYGIARVTVDGGTPVLVDLYSATYGNKRIVWSTSGLANAPHTLLVEWTGTKNLAASTTFINVDALDVTGTLN